MGIKKFRSWSEKSVLWYYDFTFKVSFCCSAATADCMSFASLVDMSEAKSHVTVGIGICWCDSIVAICRSESPL